MKNILLHHIPKNAGTAFASACKQTLGMNLKRYFTTHKICETLECSNNEIDKFTLEKLYNKKEIKNSQYTPCIDIEEIKNNTATILYAHEFKGAVDCLFNNNNWYTVCIFRNPLERFFSMIAQRQRNNCVHLFDNCYEKYQFYFFYREWCRDDHLLRLNDQNINAIFEKACSYLNKFEVVFDQQNLNNAFEKKFGAKFIADERNSNKTNEDMIISIPYKIQKLYMNYIDYEYEFYNITKSKLQF